MYFLYTLSLVALFAVGTPYFAYQAVRYRKYTGSVRQRMGYLPLSVNPDGDASIWIHAVSVGEVLTARALTGPLRARHPRLRIFLSTTTMTGQQVARTDVPGVDAVFYFPFDLPFIIRRTLRIVRPRLFVMMETEIWPNLLRACRAAGVRTVVANGRLSPRSFTRYRLVRPLFRRVLADLDRICAQNDEMARRFVALGADRTRMVVTGNLKFDSLKTAVSPEHEVGQHRVLRYFRIPRDRLVLVAGSTLRGEELAVLRVFARIRRDQPGALLVVAPRHPERFGEVAQLARDEGFRTERRTELPIDGDPRADVVVLDTIGELAQVYQIATIVFVGGSLVDAGGHNILEPAAFGRPIVFGPHMQNFRDIASSFLAAGAAVQVGSAGELEAELRNLIGNPGRRARLGLAASAIVEANRGAKDRTLAVVSELLPPGSARGSDGTVRAFRLVR